MSWLSKISNRSEYLNELAIHLSRLPESERSDILRDQDEFFREAVLSGRTEADVIGSLGEPRQLAKTLIAESRVAASESAFRVSSDPGKAMGHANENDSPAALKPASLPTQVSSMLRAFIAIIALAPFNLIFVLGPFLALMGCLFAAWAIGSAGLVAGIGSIFFILKELTGAGASIWAHISAICLAMGVTMFCLAFLGMMSVVTSWIAQGTVRYLRWNLDLIAERK